MEGICRFALRSRLTSLIVAYFPCKSWGSELGERLAETRQIDTFGEGCSGLGSMSRFRLQPLGHCWLEPNVKGVDDTEIMSHCAVGWPSMVAGISGACVHRWKGCNSTPTVPCSEVPRLVSCRGMSQLQVSNTVTVKTCPHCCRQNYARLQVPGMTLSSTIETLVIKIQFDRGRHRKCTAWRPEAVAPRPCPLSSSLDQRTAVNVVQRQTLIWTEIQKGNSGEK